MPFAAEVSNNKCDITDKKCRACPKKLPITDEKYVTRCVNCNNPYHTSCAKRKLKDGLCNYCVEAGSASSSVMAAPSNELKAFMKSTIDGLKTDLEAKVDRTEASLKSEIDQTQASLKSEIVKVGREVNILRQKHEVLRGEHDELKAAYETAKNDLEALKAYHEILKSIVTMSETRDPVQESIKELTERAIRQKNSIIYGAPETGESKKQQTNSPDDVKLVKAIFRLLSPELVKLSFTTYRIGNRDPREIITPRPLKVSLPTTADGILFRNIFIAQRKAKEPLLEELKVSEDRTKRQREDYRRKMEQKKQRQARGEKGLILVERLGEFAVIKKPTKPPPPISTSTPTSNRPTAGTILS